MQVGVGCYLRRLLSIVLVRTTFAPPSKLDTMVDIAHKLFKLIY